MSLGNRYAQHSFAQIPQVNIPRSKFDRSFTIKDTFDFDYLIPFYVDEILPGDTFNVNVSVFARLATQKVPIMDNMYVDYFFFFVPNRLVFDNWEKLNGFQENPDDTTDYLMPTLTTTGEQFEVDTIYDKFGLPTDVTGVPVDNTLPLRAYNLIWNEWFRDQNLQDSVSVPKDNGPDAIADFMLLKRGKRHDYFNSCLPFPQKGPTVELPLGTSAPILASTVLNPKTTNSDLQFSIDNGTQNFTITGVNGSATIQKPGAGFSNPGSNDFRWGNNNTSAGLEIRVADIESTLTADLSDATAATINALRQAFQMQSLFELDARGGTRYVEVLRAHFGVISPDFRLQRPEFLGGGESKINVHPVAQTTPVISASTPQANLASFATTSATGNKIGFTKSFVEHGYVIGLACARADITYQQGLNRMWSRKTRYDFFWPKLQEIGEQAVPYKEIYTQGSAGVTPGETDEDTFGYQERYGEYRNRLSEIHGKFRSTYATSLDYWHMAEEFESLPQLNDEYIVQNTPVDRAIAVPSEPHLLFDAWINQKCARPMVSYPTPASLGRF